MRGDIDNNQGDFTLVVIYIKKLFPEQSYRIHRKKWDDERL